MPLASSPGFLALDPYLPAALALPLAALAAVGLDRLFGEARRWHPLVGFGVLAGAIESAWNVGRQRRLRGLAACAFLVLSLPLLFGWQFPSGLPGWLLHVLLLYLALGGRSLHEHAGRVAADLARGDLPAARQHVGWMVSRQTDDLDASGVAGACVESTLENGNDAVFATLFWFALLGGPGALLHRLANTLDAMWGYRDQRYVEFGWAAARLDDALNFIPARLTALSYALCGRTRSGLRCWRRQAAAWKSANAGTVMAAGAGSLGVTLGGPASYHGRREQRPSLGEGRPAIGDDIAQTLSLLRRCLALWLTLLVCWGLASA